MTRLLLALAATVTILATPASAKILFVCGGAAQPEADFSNRSELSRLFEATRISATTDAGGLEGQVALFEDENGYDVVLNWGEDNATSLRATGASILGNGFGTSLVHLMISRGDDAPLEHFVFSEENNRLGQLVHTSQGADGEPEQKTLCVLP
jgi:hypothetical protein